MDIEMYTKINVMDTCIHVFDMNQTFLGDAFSVEGYICVIMTYLKAFKHKALGLFKISNYLFI